jgi:DNA-binding CsgD family transcriptional regulator
MAHTISDHRPAPRLSRFDALYTAPCDIADAEHARTALELLSDHLIEGAATFDAAGSVVRMNSALLRMLEQEPERESLSRELDHAASVLRCYRTSKSKHDRSETVTLEVMERELRTCAARYRLSAIWAGRDRRDDSGSVIVLVERVMKGVIDGAVLCDRFHLTPREMQVTRVLATGCSTAALADVLDISVHTARRHLEHILAKLGVHSRAAAVAMLRAD